LNLPNQKALSNLAKKNRIIPKLFWYAVTVLLIYFMLSRFDILPSFSSLFTSRPVTIDNTAVLVKETRAMAQLMTLASYYEVVADSTKFTRGSVPSGIGLPVPVTISSKLVILARGRIIAGCNLEKLMPEHFYIHKDSVSVMLPKAELLDIIINPSDYEIFSETGNWSAAEVNQLKIMARNKMTALALSQQILEKAGARSKWIMENLLTGIGFKKVKVEPGN
jgi:hypothetical protein